MIRHFFIGMFLSIGLTQVDAQDKVYSTTDGKIAFVSEAPLETITASSKKMEGLLDAEALTFGFSVAIRTFEGFNNGLQRQHFYENYMETDKYPAATFSGKIIEHVDLTKAGTYSIRAKGQLTIHGHVKERIIKVELVSTGKEVKTSTLFYVPLADHQIEVPRIVNQKIAQDIEVSIQATLHLTGRP